MAPSGEAVYATLLMNDAYLPGAMVMGHSLKDRGASVRLVVLATLDNLSPSTITELKTVYDEIIPTNPIVNRHPANLYLMDRPDLFSTFTKIELWRQTQFGRIVYLDADMVALRAPNELLTHSADFAAVPDIGWPDCFNSGLLVLNPNLGDYYSLLALAQRGISFDGADQGLLNMHFQNWERLSFTYNCTPSANYQYIPAYKHFQSSINVVHFIGREKPWTLGRDNKHTSGVYGELLGRWWATYDKHYRIHTSSYASGSRDKSNIVQNYVKGETTASYQGYSSAVQYPPEASIISTETIMGDRPDQVEQLDKQQVEPVATAEQRRFSAPQAEWDASRAPPPTGSRPEAPNFPSHTYEFTKDTSLFQPPRYPAAPDGMYYQVPANSIKDTKLKPIFPWEAYAPRPTRVFPHEHPPSPDVSYESQTSTTSAPKPASPMTNPSDTSGSSVKTRESISSPTSETDQWSSYSRTNAWDAMPEIERYVQALHIQQRKGKVQVLHQSSIYSESQPDAEEDSGVSRRPSMKLTDFPTEVERPSLPVTPAPRRPSFWGEERDEAGGLPAAEGVPSQKDWNPIQKLEELQKRQSEVLQNGPNLTTRELPQREMPENATKGSPPEFSPSSFKKATLGAVSGPAEVQAPVTAPPSAPTEPTSALPKKGILKEPSFEVGFEPAEDDAEEESVPPEETAPTSV